MGKQRKRSSDPITGARQSVIDSWMLAKYRDNKPESYVPTKGDTISARQGFNAGIKGQKPSFPIEQADVYYQTMFQTGQALRQGNSVKDIDYDSFGFKNKVVDKLKK